MKLVVIRLRHLSSLSVLELQDLRGTFFASFGPGFEELLRSGAPWFSPEPHIPWKRSSNNYNLYLQVIAKSILTLGLRYNFIKPHQMLPVFCLIESCPKFLHYFTNGKS